MGWFRKEKDVIDLGEYYRKKKEKEAQVDNLEEGQESTPVESGMSFLGGLASSAKAQESEVESIDVSSGEDRKTRLAKRLADMTTKLEDLSNQIYHLQQRVELLERKAGVGERFRDNP